MGRFQRAGFILALVLEVLAGPAWAGRAERLNFLGTDFVVYWVDFESEELGLFWQDASGKPLATLTRLKEHLAARSLEVKFAINAGIYSTTSGPVGLHIEESKVLRPLNLGEREGGQFNFYLKPNGVFYVAGEGPAVVESGRFAALAVRPRLACQSGPLLVSEGRIHPAFRPESTNLHWRTGVGVTKERKVVFAFSKQALRFHNFARLFQERLECPNALYLDGDICAIYLPELGYPGDQGSVRFAAMFAVTARPKPSRNGADQSPRPPSP
jgi:uncharacterized protein YigE (DUF2233 family)